MKINPRNCRYSEAIELDRNGCLSSLQSGEYGRVVFYTVDEGAEFFSSYFSSIPEGFCGGELELAVDKNGELVEGAEVLLWISKKDTNGGVENCDFTQYNSDISELVSDFRERGDLYERI